MLVSPIRIVFVVEDSPVSWLPCLLRVSSSLFLACASDSLLILLSRGVTRSLSSLTEAIVVVDGGDGESGFADLVWQLYHTLELDSCVAI